jgi:hypothetical protein
MLQEVPPPTTVATVTQVAEQPSGTPSIVFWDDVQGKPLFGTASTRDVPAAGDAAVNEVVLGDDTRLTGDRPTNSNLISDATVVGKALLTAPTQVAARGSLGISAVGEALFTSATPLDGRNTLGLGTISTQNANAVNITGGTIAGITDLAVADGGTGASTAAGARTNLGSGANGDALFTGATAAANRTTLGGSTIGQNIFTAADLAAVLALLSSTNQPTFRNLAINGDCVINQAVATASTVTGTYHADMWLVSTPGSRITAQQTSAAGGAPGFPFSFLSTVTTAGAPAAGENGFHQTCIEGTFMRFLGWGAAGASSIVVSFKVISSVAGTFALAARNAGANRSYVTPLVINTPNVWEDKTFVIPGDETGTWPTGNAGSLQFFITNTVGSTFATSSSNVWQAGNLVGLTGQTQLSVTLGATFRTTAFQVEPGIVATPYERVPLDVMMLRCQRYWQSNYAYGVTPGAAGNSMDACTGMAINANDLIVLKGGLFAVPMMAVPVVSVFAINGAASNIRRVNTGGNIAITTGMTESSRGMYSCSAAGALTTNELYDFYYAAAIRI